MFIGQIALILVGFWAWGPSPGHAKPFANHSFAFQLLVTVVAMPFVETLIGQWLPIRLVSGVLRQPFWLGGLASAIAFTCLHGYTDRAVLSIFLGATVLAAVFVIEAQRLGRPELSTYVTHALANALVIMLRLI
ncbi:CPBP family glutamic-type intramembrane protease [Caballeronia sp. GAWG2-1]|uniref:CPBP family glutamic-type intramembrane protease n=1 Tax=Caballeronia sp. GAWG2-1 TaxID=2921744 RepID=UPI0020284611|nr:CPBP family glutamic-type intramembrane protease [Caballeronia sp. GAWG2-1]